MCSFMTSVGGVLSIQRSEMEYGLEEAEESGIDYRLVI